MHGRASIEVNGRPVEVWFNNFSKIEMGKTLGNASPGEAITSDIELIKRIKVMAESNHLLLLREVIWSGILGHSYATDTIPSIKRSELFEWIATEPETTLYGCWEIFLGAMGMKLTGVEPVEDEKKKTRSRSRKK